MRSPPSIPINDDEYTLKEKLSNNNVVPIHNWKPFFFERSWDKKI
jgi:hypothetical protein